MDFTGEFLIPGKTEKRIEEDHFARYRFAKSYVINKRIIDIACGVGYGSEILDNSFSEYTGVDINKENIAYANKHYKNDHVNYFIDDIKGYSADPYEVILCFETIEHIKEYRQVLKNLYQLLIDGGLLLISSPNRKITSKYAKTIQDKPENEYHTQEFLIEELIAELRIAGFKYDIEIFGQRQSYKFKNKWIQKAYNYFFKPKTRSSPKVKAVKNKEPRYFILIARK